MKESRAPLRLLTRDRDAAVEAVRSGQAHLDVAALESRPVGPEAHLLTRVRQVVVLPRRHFPARQREVRLKDLAGQRLIVPPPDRPHRMVLARALQSAGVAWEVAVEATGWDLMLYFARLGLGFFVVNEFCDIPGGMIAKPLSALPDTGSVSDTAG